MSPDRSPNVLDAATAFTRQAALMIATTPMEGRALAFVVIERDFGREWLRSQMDAIWGLVGEIDVSGGAGGEGGVTRSRHVGHDPHRKPGSK